MQKANQAFPDALVGNYEGLISQLQLPDEDDRHVLAAAIKTNANVIVTNNLKDFPEEYLDTFGLKAKSADDFLTDIIDLNQEQAIKAFREMVLNRKNPAMDEYQVLESLRKNGLIDTANYLHALL
ncbi:PIN domain-containing protein [Pedobacter suwonensis]|uniref:PIN domain-containing protein n=1 Tax=Pedobacter suwonensis TaxID=332999 RepID=A0A1I0U7H7_9SPHI|nr:PIN domain-containing protein [Pedobacter suwonensis]SFA59870.1 PIN domain-containing protein [Pedobacter suwonensis]